jgi:menaquinone-specific isochorismate synthase
MIVTTRPIADPVELLARLPHTDPVAWVRDGEGLIGWGVAARLEVRGNERFSRTQRWWSTLCASLDIDDTVSMPGTGPVAFGSFSFDSESGSSIVVVPQVVVGRRAGQAWITVIGRQSGARPSLPPVSVPERPVSVTWSEGSRSPIEWQASVAEAVRRIKAGELDKVRLERCVTRKLAVQRAFPALEAVVGQSANAGRHVRRRQRWIEGAPDDKIDQSDHQGNQQCPGPASGIALRRIFLR